MQYDFQSEKINISSGEINEALSRMFRKTMIEYFGVEGRSFVRQPFMVKMQELNIQRTGKITYNRYKREIDQQTNQLVKKLNKVYS